MIESGKKKEEYREIKPYWLSRLCFSKHMGDCKERQRECTECFKFALACEGYICYPYTHVRFRLGYTKRTMLREIDTIEFGYCNPEWGAPTDKMVFIIKFKEGGVEQ